MAAITSEIRCWNRETQEHEEGYREPRTVFYQIFKRHYRLFGMPIWVKTIFCEEVPIWAKAQAACSGWTDWKSAAPQWMHEAVNKGRGI